MTVDAPTGPSPTAPAVRAGRPTRTEFSLFVCLPLVFTAIAALIFGGSHLLGVNFHSEFWPAGSRVLHGQSPYVIGSTQIAAGTAFPYPATAALLFAPFALLPEGVGEAVFVVLCFGAVAGTLRALDVSDWRLYGVAFLWAPVLLAWQTANLSLLLCLGLAMIWRYRDKPVVAGALTAAVISLKPFVWPLALWLVATRRYRAAAWAAGTGVALNAVAWAVVGFGEIHRYLTDASKVSAYFYRHVYTVVALALHLGLGRTAAELVAAALGASAAALCLIWGRRGEELRALTMCVALVLIATPVQWMHYFVLVLVPLAIARPRLHWSWWLPIALLPVSTSNPVAWQVALTFPVLAIMLYPIATGKAPVGSDTAEPQRRADRTRPISRVLPRRRAYELDDGRVHA
jgi:hypothetical protein